MSDEKHVDETEKQAVEPVDTPVDAANAKTADMPYEPDGDTFTTELDNLLDMLGKGMDVDSIKAELASSQAAETAPPRVFDLVPVGGHIFESTHADSTPVELLKSLTDQIDTKCPFDYAMLLAEVTHKPEYLRMNAVIDRQKKVHSGQRVYPLKDSVLSEAVNQKRPVVFNLTETPRGKFEKELYDRLGLRSCLLIPVPDSGAGSGMLAIGAKKESRYADAGDEVEWLSCSLSLAIQHRQLASALEKQSAALELIKQIGRATVANDFDFDRLLKFALLKLRDIFDLEAGVIYLKEKERLNAVLTSNTGAEGIQLLRRKIGQRLAGVVVSRGKPMIVNDTQKLVKSTGELAKQKVLNTRAILCVPLMSQGKSLGAMEFYSKENVEIEKMDDTLLNTVAVALGAALRRHLNP